MSLPDPGDPEISNLLDSWIGLADSANIAFDGSQIQSPVVSISHLGRADGFDLYSAVLRLNIETEGTGCRGLVITGDTLGDLILVDNDDLTRYALRLTPDGRLGISTLRANDVQARLEVAQAATDTIGLLVFAKGSTGENLIQVVNNSGIDTLWVDVSGELHTIKSAFFSGPAVQVGSQTYDGATFSGSVIGLKNLTSTSFTGAPTDGLNIAATNGKLRYLDTDGVVWRLPTGNPICDLHGLSSWNYDPTNATGEAAPLAGVVYLMKTLFPRSVQASTFRFEVTNNSAVPTDTYLGVYDLAGNLLTQTADVSAMMTTVGSKSAAMVSPPVMPPKYYYIAFLIGSYAGGGPKLSIAGVPAGIANTNLVAPNLRFATYSSGLTALPSTITMASQVSTGHQFWVGTA